MKCTELDKLIIVYNSKIRIFIFCFFIFFLNVLTSIAFSQTKIFLVAGQSNAQALGDSSLSNVYIRSNPGLYYEYKYSGDYLSLLKDPVGVELPLYNPFLQSFYGSSWPSFAKTYVQLSGNKIILVHTTRGSTSLHPKAEKFVGNVGSWDSQDILFNASVKKTNMALRHTGLALSGIIWWQGETDADAIKLNKISKEDYKISLENLIYQYREIYGKTLKFYIVQLGRRYWDHDNNTSTAMVIDDLGYAEIRHIQDEIDLNDEHTSIVCRPFTFFGLAGYKSDGFHYNQQSLNKIGEEIAKKIVELENIEIK